MVEKVKVTKAVEELLSRNPNWRPALANGIASPSKVAHQIHAEVAKMIGKPPKSLRLDTVVKAVKIYVEGTAKASDMDRVKKLLSEAKLTLMSDLATLTVRAGPDTGKRIADVVQITHQGDQKLYIGQSGLQITFIFSLENLSRIKSLFKPNELLDSNKNYTGILIESSGLSTYNPIDYDSYLLGLLSSNGIPLAGYMSFFTDTIIILESQHTLNAFQILKTEIERLRKGNG